MYKLTISAIAALALTACDSSSVSNGASGGATESSISIAATQRDTLDSLPNVSFNGQYETTARPELGTGGGGGGGDDSSLVDGDAVSSTAESTDAVDGRIASDILIFPPTNPNPSINPGTLTAGDYDDQLNPHLYQNYASDYLQRRGQWIDTPRLDFNNRIQIAVSNKNGQPYAGAEIEAGSVTLQSAANGVASLYTGLDSLPQDFTLKVTARDGTSVSQSINLQQARNAGQIEVTLATTDAAQGSNAVDLMFVIDTTGSMGDELSFLQTELSDIINSIPNQLSDINIGLVFYRDYGDNYVVRAHEFSDNINAVQLNLNQEQARGGGDYPEAMDQALQTAMAADWRTDSRKVLFLIADAPPHGDRMRATWNAAQQARDNNIHLVPVAASGVAEDAEYIMRSVAALTHGRYLFLTDDSGFGAPHAEPDVDCYVVTSLRSSMIRALNSLLSGDRVEPTDNDIIRTAGNYNNGVCEQVQPTPDPNTIDYSILVERANPRSGGAADRQTVVAGNQSEFDSLLTTYGEEPISLDFTNTQALLVDMGQQNTGGYSIGISSVTEFDDYVQANVVYNHPGNNCAVTLALTNPILIASIATNKEIRVSETTVSVDCAF
jgi:hypothetical protein